MTSIPTHKAGDRRARRAGGCRIRNAVPRNDATAIDRWIVASTALSLFPGRRRSAGFGGKRGAGGASPPPAGR